MRCFSRWLGAAALWIVLCPGLCVAWEFELLETRGSAYERGLQHGHRFAAEIQKDFAAAPGYGFSIALVNRQPGVLAGFLQRVLALPGGQDLIDEMQGIADGSGIPFADIAALNCTYDLGDRQACSMALSPRGPDGPILANTLDDFPSGKERRNYPCFVQVAYPTTGHAITYLTNFGTVWVHQGLNDAGLAIGGTSGGIGAPRNGINYEGVYAPLLARSALQFHDSAHHVIALFHDRRGTTKGINVSVLDRQGQGAIFEYAAMAVGVRLVEDDRPLYATNFFQTPAFPKYTPADESYDYMKNARARYRRLGELLDGSGGSLGLAQARSLVLDHYNGQQGQICQANAVMHTVLAGVFECRTATAHWYLGHPALTTAKDVVLSAARKPATGAPAPQSPAVQAILAATPRKVQRQYVSLKDATLAQVREGGLRFVVRTAQGDRPSELAGASPETYTPGTMADVPPDTRTALWGKAEPDAAGFQASRIITYRPGHRWSNNGRCIATEASGLLRQDGGRTMLQYDDNKAAIPVTLAADAQVFISHKAQPADLKDGAVVDVHAYTLFEGDTLHVFGLVLYADAGTPAGAKAGSR